MIIILIEITALIVYNNDNKNSIDSNNHADSRSNNINNPSNSDCYCNNNDNVSIILMIKK